VSVIQDLCISDIQEALFRVERKEIASKRSGKNLDYITVIVAIRIVEPNLLRTLINKETKKHMISDQSHCRVQELKTTATYL